MKIKRGRTDSSRNSDLTEDELAKASGGHGKIKISAAAEKVLHAWEPKLAAAERSVAHLRQRDRGLSSMLDGLGKFVVLHGNVSMEIVKGHIKYVAGKGGSVQYVDAQKDFDKGLKQSTLKGLVQAEGGLPYMK